MSSPSCDSFGCTNAPTLKPVFVMRVGTCRARLVSERALCKTCALERSRCELVGERYAVELSMVRAGFGSLGLPEPSLIAVDFIPIGEPAW